MEFHHVAQRQIDWILGCNPYDRSSVEGVGYNQPQRGFYGEFFPPTPQIPGAVSTGMTSESIISQDSGFANEYDMPIVGLVLWLMTDLAERSSDRLHLRRPEQSLPTGPKTQLENRLLNR